MHQIIDPEAVRIVKENRVKTIVVNGLNPENIAGAISGEVGTEIQ